MKMFSSLSNLESELIQAERAMSLLKAVEGAMEYHVLSEEDSKNALGLALELVDEGIRKTREKFNEAWEASKNLNEHEDADTAI